MDSDQEVESSLSLSLTPVDVLAAKSVKEAQSVNLSYNLELDSDEEMDLKQAISLSLTPAGKPNREVEAKVSGPGYKFLPTDDEIMVHLTRKLSNRAYEFEEITEADVYEHHPMILTGLQVSRGDNTWYFFYDRSLNTGSAICTKQTASKGVWKSQGEVPIYGLANRIGSKTSLDFIEETPEGRKVEWVMEQYHQANLKVDSYVLCKIYRIAPRSVYDDNLTLGLSLSQGKTMIRKKLTADHDWIFAPSEVELSRYLNRKLQDHNYSNQAITEANIYEHHPKELYEQYQKTGENCLFFFCPKDHSKYQLRTGGSAKGGYWHSSTGEKDVMDGNKAIGLRKPFSFREGDRNNYKLTEWKMIEFRNADYEGVKSYVLCKIYQNEVQKRKIEEDESEIQKQPRKKAEDERSPRRKGI